MNGTVIAIFVTETSAAPMQAVDSAEAVAGKGLRGDRNFHAAAGQGKHDPEEELTLIESEAIEAVNRDYPLQLEPIETRRNLLTRGISLNHLVGREFTVGQVRLRGLRLCEPCKHLESMTRPGVMRSLVHRGGLRAEIIAGGTIRVGDAIAAEPQAVPVGA